MSSRVASILAVLAYLAFLAAYGVAVFRVDEWLAYSRH